MAKRRKFSSMIAEPEELIAPVKLPKPVQSVKRRWHKADGDYRSPKGSVVSSSVRG